MKNHLKLHGIVHLFWVIILLILSLIAVVSLKDTGSNLYNYISFASAISSILLSLVAIFYAMISSQSFSETVGVLRSNNDNISLNATAIRSTAESLSTLVQDVAGTVSKVPDTVAAMSTELSSRLDKLAEKGVHNSLSGSISANQNSKDIIVTEIIFPLGVVLALYCLQLSHDKKRSFKTSDISTSKYIEGMIFGVVSFIVGTKFASAEIRQVDTNFQAVDLGNIDTTGLGDFIDGQSPEAIAKMKRKIDMYFGIIEEEDSPLENIE